MQFKLKGLATTNSIISMIDLRLSPIVDLFKGAGFTVIQRPFDTYEIIGQNVSIWLAFNERENTYLFMISSPGDDHYDVLDGSDVQQFFKGDMNIFKNFSKDSNAIISFLNGPGADILNDSRDIVARYRPYRADVDLRYTNQFLRR